MYSGFRLREETESEFSLKKFGQNLAFFVVVPKNRIIRVQLVEAKLLWLKRYKYTTCFSNLSSNQFI